MVHIHNRNQFSHKEKIMEIYKKYLQFSTSLDYEEVEVDFESTILLNRDWSYFYKKKKDR